MDATVRRERGLGSGERGPSERPRRWRSQEQADQHKPASRSACRRSPNPQTSSPAGQSPTQAKPSARPSRPTRTQRQRICVEMATQGYLSEHRRSHIDELTNYFLNGTLRHRLCSKSFVAIPEKGGSTCASRRRQSAAPPAPPGFLMPAAKDEWWRVAPWPLHVITTDRRGRHHRRKLGDRTCGVSGKSRLISVKSAAPEIVHRTADQAIERTGARVNLILKLAIRKRHHLIKKIVLVAAGDEIDVAALHLCCKWLSPNLLGPCDLVGIDLEAAEISDRALSALFAT